ncbi:hypothetical protein QLL95_gp1257 [Cotonvirus japonicus]|uniref:Uncharacterized protein n=1 Tax=Cotonvirus japonicus TaxID=2811091 RepID=A0ABM7NRY5_9VIRU|nr:hypothetical protein QLL95_gp1257 [Cotonvirus japonicus]BCS82866.1 hypothetical protein [Cotonvirus japonicus]
MDIDRQLNIIKIFNGSPFETKKKISNNDRKFQLCMKELKEKYSHKKDKNIHQTSDKLKFLLKNQETCCIFEVQLIQDEVKNYFKMIRECLEDILKSKTITQKKIENSPIVEITDKFIKSEKKITVGLDVKTILEFDGPKILGGTRQKCVLYSPIDIELEEGFVAIVNETKFNVVNNWITIGTPIPTQQPNIIKTTLPIGTVIIDGMGIPRKLEVELEVDLPNPCSAILYAGTRLQQFKPQGEFPIDLQLELVNKHKVNIIF